MAHSNTILGQLALREGRSNSAMVHVLLRAALEARNSGPTVALAIDGDKQYAGRIIVKLQSTSHRILQRLCADEDRSLSSMTRMLIREALRGRGLWPDNEAASGSAETVAA
jgi:hypothetical protein